MKNKNGFTLVELLAVVLVLGIVASIVSLSVVGIKRSAAKNTFKRLEKQIADLGPQIHSHEFLMGNKTDADSYYQKSKGTDIFIIPLDSLKTAGYIDDIKSPFGSNNCTGYLYVDPSAGDSNDMFVGKLDCTTDASDTDPDKKSDGYNDSQPTAKISKIN